MLKITSRNEIINRRMARKEITYLLYKLFNCFFVSSNKFKNSLVSKIRNSSPRLKKKKQPVFSQRQVLIFQFKRYGLTWFSKLSFRSPFTKGYSVCFLTGRSRSVYRAFRLSRLKVRQFAAMGYFIGLSKASW